MKVSEMGERQVGVWKEGIYTSREEGNEREGAERDDNVDHLKSYKIGAAAL